MKESKITTFYHPKMCPPLLGTGSESMSPLKPRLLIEFIQRNGFATHFDLIDSFNPFQQKDFYMAHTLDYVNGFFSGKEPHSTGKGLLGIKWSEAYAESTLYTNSSLYQAILTSIQHPSKICLSPTSGFHHAVPEHGALFCPFSGQVIAAMKIYQELGLSGAFIDLDGHYGNSIDDSRYFVAGLEKAIPERCNVNIKTKHQEYLEDLKIRLLILQEMFLENKIHYVVFCHGADSHEDDDIGVQLNTQEWLECVTIFCEWIQKTEALSGKVIPVSLSLFGGYRHDNYDFVLALHTASILKTLSLLSGINIVYQFQIGKNPRKNYINYLSGDASL